MLLALVCACGEGPAETGRRLIEEAPAAQLAPPSDPDAPVSNPAVANGPAGTARFEAPSPGQANVVEVTVASAEASVGLDSRLVVKPVWVSGPPPCHVLDHTTSRVVGDTVEVHVFEGGSTDTPCPEIGVLRTTDVDVGVVPAGTYRLLVGPPTGEAPASVVKSLEIPA